MIEAARLGVYVTAEGVDETKKKVSGLGDTLSGVAGKAMVAGGVLSAAVTGPLLMMGNRAVDAASDVVESMNKVDVVFGSTSGVVKAFADDAAANLGITEAAALEAAGTFGNMFDAMGVGEQMSADMSTQLLQMAADLGSFNNIDPTIMLDKLRSGLVGEVEPLRQVGILLDAESVKLKAVEMGLASSTKNVDQAALVQARLALITEQSTNAMGDFARTADGNANATRIMQASMVDLTATIGTQLLPIKLQLVQVLQQVITWFQALNPSTQGMIVVFGALAAVLGPLLLILGSLATAIAAIGLPVLAVVAAIGLLGAAWATNFGGIRDLTMPIIEQIQAWFGEMIPVAIAKFKNILVEVGEFITPAMRRIQDAVGPMVESFSPLGEKIAAVWAIVEPVLSALANIIGTVVVVAFNLLLEVVAAVMPSIGTIIGNAIDIAVTVLETLSTVVTEVVAIVKALIEGDWAAVWEHAQVILETLWEAVETIFGEILDTILIVIGDILEAITNWLGNLNAEWAKKFGELVTAAKSKMLEVYNSIKMQLASIVDAVKGFSLRDAGAALIDGMIEGIKAKAGALVSAAQGVVQNAVNAAKALLGIHSPSTVFLEIGRNIMAGLVEGIDQETPASVVAMSDAMSAIVDAVGKVLGIFGSLDSMTVIGNVGGKMATFRDQVKSIIIELKALAEYYGSPEAQSAHVSAKAVLEFVVPLFENMQKVMDAIQTFADLEPIADAKTQMDKVVAGIRAMISGVAEVAAGPEMAQLTTATEAGLNLSLFAAAVEGIFGPLREAAKAWETIKGFDFSNMKVEPVLRWLASFGAMAVQAVEWARSWAGTAGEGMGAFIAGVGTAVKGLADVARSWEVIQKFNWSVVDADAVVKWLASLGGLAIKAMNWASTWAAPGAGLDAFATAVKTSLGGLVEVAKAWEVLQGFKWNAGLDVKKVIDWLAALGGLAVTALLNVAAWGQFQTLDDKAKEMAANMVAAFGALSAALRFTDELRVWKILPDIEAKFDRLLRAIEYIVPQFEKTRRAVGELAYEEIGKFSQALRDVTAGLQAAIDLFSLDLTNLQFPDETVWTGIEDWIKVVFKKFSDWIMANPDLTATAPVVKTFGDALGTVMGALKNAALLALELPKTWTTPPDDTLLPVIDWMMHVFKLFEGAIGRWFPDTTEEAKKWPVVQQFAQAVGTVLTAIRDAALLAFELPKVWVTPADTVLLPVIDWMMHVFKLFEGRLGQWFPNTDEEAKKWPVVVQFAQAVGTVLSAIRDAALLAFELPKAWVTPPDDTLLPVIDWMMHVFKLFEGRLGQWFPDTTEEAKKWPVVAEFATDVGLVLTAIRDAALLAMELPKTWTTPADTVVKPVIDWMIHVFGLFQTALALAFPDTTEEAKKWPTTVAFAQAVGTVLGAIRDAALLAFELPKTWAAPADTVVKPVIDWMIYAFQMFQTAMIAAFPDTTEEAKKWPVTVAFASAVGTVMGALKSALDLSLALPKTWAAPTDEMWDPFQAWVMKVFTALYSWLNSTGTYQDKPVPFGKDGLDLVSAFGGALSSLMSGLGTSFAVFAGLVGFVAPSSAQFEAFKTAVQKVFDDFATYAKTTLVVSANAAVKAFGEAMGALFGGLNTALTFTSAVYKESPAFFAFLASAGTTGGDFQVKMGLIFTSITETMSRFKTNVVDKVKTDWLPAANTLLSAVQSVFNVLSQALNIFKDLNTAGMPSSSTITAFIDSVLNLFNRFTTGLGLVPGQAAGAASGVQSTMSAWAATLAQDTMRWYNIGYAFGGMLAAGWADAMTYQTKAGSFMLSSTYAVTEAIKTAIKTAFGIHSPSTVMAEYGNQMAMGLGLGMQQGLAALGLPGLNGQPMQLAYAGLPTQTVRVQVAGDLRIGGQRVTPEMADEIAYLLTQRLRLRA